MSSISPLPPRCWAEINCAAIRHNAEVCRGLAGENCEVMAIVKANAYGHGLEKIGPVLAEAGVSWFGVANVEEAMRLSDVVAGYDGILVLGSAACEEEREVIVASGFSGSISSINEMETYAAIAKENAQLAKLHVIVDTGMGRMGVEKTKLAELVEAILENDALRLEGVGTHFPSADVDADFTENQIAEFNDLVANLELPDDCQLHLANSAGLIGFQQKMPQAALVRPGLAIYGVSPLPEIAADLKPALTLKTRITLIRELAEGASVSYGRTFIADKSIRTATLAVGYGDGYPRHLSEEGVEILIAGKRCPLLGRVTMDQIVVDISALGENEVRVGDEAVLIGDQGTGSILTAEIAGKAGTIPWEILTGLTTRVRRVYV